MLKVKEAWESYVAEVLPADCGSTQFIETRRSFYGGAQALYCILFRGLATSDGEDMTPADEAFIMGVEAELVKFSEDVKAGRA